MPPNASNKVLLPQPDGPFTTTNSPRAIDRSRPASASTSPVAPGKRRSMCSQTIIVQSARKVFAGSCATASMVGNKLARAANAGARSNAHSNNAGSARRLRAVT